MARKDNLFSAQGLKQLSLEHFIVLFYTRIGGVQYRRKRDGKITYLNYIEKALEVYNKVNKEP